MRSSLAVLGTTEVRIAGQATSLRPSERSVLAVLSLRHPLATERDDLIDGLWPDGPPASARASVQNHIARLRQALSPDSVLTEASGYRLHERWSLDTTEADALSARGRRAILAGRPVTALRHLRQALALERGMPYADLVDQPFVAAARSRRGELRRSTEDELLLALVSNADGGHTVAEALVLTEAEPFREVRWCALALALYRDGQRRESLRALQRGQSSLRDLVGLDGGPGLLWLETLVLDDDRRLLTDPPATLLRRPSPDPVLLRPPPPDRRTPTANNALPTSFGHLLRTARSARAESRHGDAAEALGAAVLIAKDRWGVDDRRALVLELHHAEALRLVGDAAGPDLVWRVVRAADSAGHAELFAEAAAALCQLGPLIGAGTLDHEVADVVERAIAGSSSPATRARCASQASLLYSMSGRIDRCRSHFETSLIEARRSGDANVLLAALSGTYVSLTHPDDWSRRSELAAEMLALAEERGDADATFGALHLYFSTQLVSADPLIRTTFARQEELARTLRSAGRRWMAGYQRACLAYLDARLDDALEIADDILASAPVAPSRAQTNHGMTVLNVRLAQGRGQELAAGIDATIEAQPGLPGWRAVAAWLAALVGDQDRVRHEWAILEQGATLPADMSWGGAAVLLGRAVAVAGDRNDVATARSLLNPHTGLFTWYGAGTVGPFDLALAELALAAEDRPAALLHLDRAQHLVDRVRAVVYQPDLDALAARLGP